MGKKKCFYAIVRGTQVGVFDLQWKDIRPFVTGVDKPIFESFSSEKDAQSVYDAAKANGYVDTLEAGGAAPAVGSNPAAIARAAQEYDPLNIPHGHVVVNGWYAVTVGRQPGIYTTWIDTASQTYGFPRGSHQKFDNREEAVNALQEVVVSSKRQTSDPDTVGESISAPVPKREAPDALEGLRSHTAAPFARPASGRRHDTRRREIVDIVPQSSEDESDAISQLTFPTPLRSFKYESTFVPRNDSHSPHSVSACSGSSAAALPQVQGRHLSPLLSYTSAESPVIRHKRSDSLSSVDTVTSRSSNALGLAPLARPSTPITVSSDSEPDQATITVEVDGERIYMIPLERRGARPLSEPAANLDGEPTDHSREEQGIRPMDHSPEVGDRQPMEVPQERQGLRALDIPMPPAKRDMRPALFPFMQHLQLFWDEHNLTREESMRLLRSAMWELEGVQPRHPGGLSRATPDAGMIAFSYLMLLFSMMLVVIPALDRFLTLTGWHSMSQWFLLVAYFAVL
ncbi:hypothetical protein BKA70DRAFT_1558072 [Coprinopsis sp. MPI-PUGE-AT-0042]|nr:hypothetical protein BKA70DRAFT_1558072 [Coprinopsis sp. MPI-PUGE-AT-0042]